MGYFPNGTSFEIFHSTFCQHCQNWRYDEDTDAFVCPIMDLHLVWNYDDDKTKQKALSHFIEGTGIEEHECRMFLPHDSERCLKTPDMFAEANQ